MIVTPTPEPEIEPTFGFVYLVSNPAMPGIVKIGCTSHPDVKKRVDQLFSTGVPVPFDVEFACRVQDFKLVEAALHTAFQPYRINPSREFFQIGAEQAIAIMKLLHVEDVTAEVQAEPSSVSEQDQAAGTALASKRPPMNFHDMGIPDGSILTYADGTHSVAVCGPRKVVFNGEECSLSAVTQQIKNLPYSVQPSPFWFHEGKLLKTIYEETYHGGA